MPKSRKRKRSKHAKPHDIPWGGAQSRPRGSRGRLIAIAVLVVLIGGGGFMGWRSFSAERDFQALAEQGKGALSRVKTGISAGGGHLTPGQPYSYGDRFPTSGPHDRLWTGPGFYEVPQSPKRLVHAVEHGNIVIYYDTPATGVLDKLKGWAGLYGAQWSGIVITPMSGSGETIVLTAWNKTLRLKRFDAAAAAAFIDAYRGRGPERSVR